jgi:hypothetical protein
MVDLTSKPSLPLYPFAIFSRKPRSLSIRLLRFIQKHMMSLSVCVVFLLQMWLFHNLASLSSGLHIFTKSGVTSVAVCVGLLKVTLPLQRRRHTFTLAYTDCLFSLEFVLPLYPFAHFAMLHRK